MFNLKKLLAGAVVVIIGVHAGNAALVAYGVNVFAGSVSTESAQALQIRADLAGTGIDN